ncbi:uncharacterized protein LOC106635855 [Copidosoma floridanum]|uniref:uncharacterized protein LOC106635855 n=1 Tax=Copidosoma floridanum TaxID=29053 RepID=UPI0006C9A256|nr:uncharacterized protein LOC106635855 [Copidosoma floridanum]
MTNNVLVVIVVTSMVLFSNTKYKTYAAIIKDGEKDHAGRSDDENRDSDGHNDSDDNYNHDKKYDFNLTYNSIPHTSGSTRQELTAEQIKARSQFHPRDPRYKRPECWFDLHLCTPSYCSGVAAPQHCQDKEVLIHNACRPKDENP